MTSIPLLRNPNKNILKVEFINFSIYSNSPKITYHETQLPYHEKPFVSLYNYTKVNLSINKIIKVDKFKPLFFFFIFI